MLIGAGIDRFERVEDADGCLACSKPRLCAWLEASMVVVEDSADRSGDDGLDLLVAGVLTSFDPLALARRATGNALPDGPDTSLKLLILLLRLELALVPRMYDGTSFWLERELDCCVVFCDFRNGSVVLLVLSRLSLPACEADLVAVLGACAAIEAMLLDDRVIGTLNSGWAGSSKFGV